MFGKSFYRNVLLSDYLRGVSAYASHRELLKTTGLAAPSYSTCKFWFSRFSQGDLSVMDLEHTGRTGYIPEELVLEQLAKDKSQSTREIAGAIGVSHEAVRKHLKRAGKVRKKATLVPHALSAANEKRRLDICMELLERERSDPFLRRLLTCDETWILYHNEERKSYWLDKGEAALSVPQTGLHPKKQLLTVWWCGFGIVHYELLEEGTITGISIHNSLCAWDQSSEKISLVS